MSSSILVPLLLASPWLVQDLATVREITAESPASDLGRFEAIDLELVEGERLLVTAESDDFAPMLVAMSPSGRRTVAQAKRGQAAVFRSDRLDEGGEWIVGVVAPGKSLGKFGLRVRRIAPEPESADLTPFCAAMTFVLADASLGFAFSRPAIEIPGMGRAEITIGNEARAAAGDGKSLDTVSKELRSCLSGWAAEQKADSLELSREVEAGEQHVLLERLTRGGKQTVRMVAFVEKR